MTEALVEGFAPDAIGLAAWLADRGHAVRLAGTGQAPAAATALRDRGVAVDEHVDLDADPGAPAVAYLDVWTPAVAPRVARLRAAGARVTCLSDLLLARAALPIVGVTGTAGKSTTAAFAAALLRHAGVEVHEPTTGRPGQRWATEELLPLVDAPAANGVLVLELTSSHLAFCDHPPTVAVVTGIWPDHVELHGSAEAYVAAKQRIVAGQRVGDHVVVCADEPLAAPFAELTPARRWSFSTRSPVEAGATARSGRVLAVADGVSVDVGAAPGRAGGRLDAALAAVAAALAAGAPPQALVGGLDRLPSPPHRAQAVGRRGDVVLVDDSAAATARKAAQTIAALGPEATVAVVGGEPQSAGLEVQSSPDERALVAAAVDVLARCRGIVAFGPAGESLAAELRARGRAVAVAGDALDAVEQALCLADATPQARALVVSPMFPVAQETRAEIAALLRDRADRVEGADGRE